MAPLALVLGVVAAYETNFGGLRDRVNETKAAFAEGDFAGVIQGVAGSMAAIPLGLATEFGNLVGIDVPGGLSAWSGVFANIGIIAALVWEKIKTLVGGLSENLTALPGTLLTFLETPFSTAFNNVTAMFSGEEGLLSKINSFVTVILPAVLGLLYGTLTTHLSGAFESAVDKVKAFFSPEGEGSILFSIAQFVNEGILNALGELDDTLGTNLTGSFESAVEIVTDIFGDGEGSLGGLLKGIPGSLAGWLGDLPGQLQSVLVDPFITALQAIDAALPNDITVNFGTIGVPMFWDLDALKEAVMTGDMPTTPVNLGSFSIDVPDNPLSNLMPRDSGGSGKAGVPYLIRPQAGPEVYIPNAPGQFIPNVDRLLGGGGGNHFEIHVHESINPRETARQVLRELQKLAPGTSKLNTGGI